MVFVFFGLAQAFLVLGFCYGTFEIFEQEELYVTYDTPKGNNHLSLAEAYIYSIKLNVGRKKAYELLYL